MNRDPNIIEKAANAVARLADRTAKRGYGQEGQTGEGWEMSHDLLPHLIYPPLLREAEALYREAIHIHPTGWYHWQRALLLMQLGEFDQAIAAFQAHVDSGDYVNQAMADMQIRICRQLKAMPNEPQDANDSRRQIAMQATAEMFDPLGAQATAMAELMSQMMSELKDAGIGTDATPDNEAPDDAPARPHLSEAESSAVCEFGEDFAWHLVRGDWQTAHALLSQELREQLSPADLQENYTEMTSYAETDFTETQAQSPDNDMPDMADNDVAWLYVAISSDDANEAVTLMVCRENEELRVRDIEWGRP